MKHEIRQLEVNALKAYGELLELMSKNQEYVEANWHGIVIEFENVLAIARNIEHKIFMSQAKSAMAVRKLPAEIQKLIGGMP